MPNYKINHKRKNIYILNGDLTKPELGVIKYYKQEEGYELVPAKAREPRKNPNAEREKPSTLDIETWFDINKNEEGKKKFQNDKEEGRREGNPLSGYLYALKKFREDYTDNFDKILDDIHQLRIQRLAKKG